ncbi:MAG: phosphate ABC transporter substrate-binding protein PstS family protein [Acidimicrobiia bacterium]
MKATVGILVTALLVAACGGSSAPETGDQAGGAIVISGSSTVEPVSARVAETYGSERPELSISVDGPGTGDGMKVFCAGQADITGASRPIKEPEIETCNQNGVTFIEIPVAIDGLSVLTSHDNDLVACLAPADLYALVGPESIGFGTWGDANDLAAELGAANAPYPDVPLVITGPGEESGTYDAFVEMVLEDIAEERSQEAATRPDYTASANDNVIIEGISGSDTSLGWVGYAFYIANQDRVKALAIAGGEGCVEPTPETIADGSYPLSRTLYIYVSVEKAQSKPEVADFVDFYLSDEGLKAVDDAGYVRLDDYDPSRQVWETRTPGHREG